MPAVVASSTGSVETGHLVSRVRQGLDALYLACGYLAAACMIGILLMTMVQIGARFIGYNFRGASEYAGYFMAGSAFLGFPYALNEGGHIRIELFLSLMGRHRPVMEKISFGISSAIAVWLNYYCWNQVYWSFKLGDVSQGMDATPTWIPQLSMSIGSSMLALAIIDRTLRLIITGDHGLPASPDSL